MGEEGSRLEKGETQTEEKYCENVHLPLNTLAVVVDRKMQFKKKKHSSGKRAFHT